jgi:hypothetical protein
MGFEVGKTYTRPQIAEGTGGGSLQDYMPNRDGKVLCLCLSQEYVPGPEQVVLVGRGPNVEKQAAMFCAQEGPVPVFFKTQGYLWEYAGEYSCERCTEDIDEITGFEESSGRLNLSRIIFLKLFIDKA